MAVPGLQGLINHSVKVGSDPDLVQASGGNTSIKLGNKIWVKGSGKRLKDASTEKIFSEVSFGELTEETILACQDFSEYSTGNISPSIEANFHLLLQKKYVTHLHSLGAIALGVSKHSSNEIGEFLARRSISIINYSRPGVALAQLIQRSPDFQDRVLLLENHGIIFSSDNIKDLEMEIYTFENEARDFLSSLPENAKFSNWVEILTSGVLTPDEAVFLGHVPFTKSDTPLGNLITITSKGDVIFPASMSSDRIEMALFYCRVAKLVERKVDICYLSREEVDALLSWDKEKLRIAMAK